MSTEPTLIDAHDVHVHYGESHVLRGVSLSVRAGESVGLLGRNGMGKTTLIRTLMGHVRASRGRIAIRGQDATRTPPDRVARWGLAYVPEGRAIFPNLSVRENLLVAARRGVSGRNDWPIERILGTFPRLGERLNQGGQQLSGGEQQMLAIGRALSTNPDLLILDEATEGSGAADRARDLADHRRHPRLRHRLSHRRPQLPDGSCAYRPRNHSGEGPCRDGEPLGDAGDAAGRTRCAARRLAHLLR